MTSVLITGSTGHLGRALITAFRGRGDDVIGLDLPGTGADIEHDFDPYSIREWGEWDIVVCNAKARDWQVHHHLATRARRCIVNIGSIYGVLGNDPEMYVGTEVEPTPAWYSAAKGALVALTRWQAANLAPVRSNCVCPGGIYRAHSQEFVSRYVAKVPLKRMATEDDIVPVVLFLASDAARYITGQVIMVDGGYSCA